MLIMITQSDVSMDPCLSVQQIEVAEMKGRGRGIELDVEQNGNLKRGSTLLRVVHFLR